MSLVLVAAALVGLVAVVVLGRRAPAATDRPRRSPVRLAIGLVACVASVPIVLVSLLAALNVASGAELTCDVDASCRPAPGAPIGLGLAVAALAALAAIGWWNARRPLATGVLAGLVAAALLVAAGGAWWGASVDVLVPRP